MKKTLALLTSIALLSLALTALAGYDKNCDAPTEDCLKAMSAKLQKKGWLGIETEKTDSGHYRITAVHADSPAQDAGFKKGDVLLALNGIDLNSADKAKLKKTWQSTTAGASAVYTVKRAGAKQQLDVTFGRVPFNLMAEWIGEHMLKHHAGEMIAQN